MTVRAVPSATIARHMLDGAPTRMIVQTGEGMNPRDVAANIQSNLVERHPFACWIHAEHDLSPAFEFARSQRACPLVVTTETTDWSPFEVDHDWLDREASIAFVLPRTRLSSISAQVAQLLNPRHLVRRALRVTSEPAALEILVRTYDLMRPVVSAPSAMNLAITAGLAPASIDWNGPSEVVVMRVLQEALNSDRLDDLVERWHHERPATEVGLLLRDIRRLCESDD